MYLFDTFTNFLSGLGVPGRDKLTAHRYIKQVWSRDQLEASYQSDWIARKAIQIPAQDATREWRAWQAEQDQIELIEETEDRLRVQLVLQDALIKSRLYGGCCILIGVDGDMSKELDPETIPKDGLKFLHILCPHQAEVRPKFSHARMGTC
jgi:phage-related protein (TIGR01555 family)